MWKGDNASSCLILGLRVKPNLISDISILITSSSFYPSVVRMIRMGKFPKDSIVSK